MKHGFLNALLALAFFGCTVAGAQVINKGEAGRIWADAKIAAQAGPANILLPVQDTVQAALALPAGHLFIPQPHATMVLQAIGRPGTDERLQGLVLPDGDAPWYMAIRFERSGYIQDDEARSWNVDALLQSLQESTEAANAERKKTGLAETEVLGWAQKPAYDGIAHRLAWAVSSRNKGAAGDTARVVHYNTYALGREGYFSMRLVTNLNALPSYQPAAHTLLNALQFAEGKRYADFNAGTDRVSPFGLTSLVVGPATKKAGAFSGFTRWAAKFWAAGAVAVLALGVALLVWRKRRAAQVADDDGFAHTMMVDRNAPEPTLPQPLAPNPHADQVRLGQNRHNANTPGSR
nr:DUF2167 domain-containing protein [uncultured Rhodoferax sp.]